MKKQIVFVNGELFTGEITFGHYKGCGWEAGRCCYFLTAPEIPASAEVFHIDLHYGKLRHCKPVDDPFHKDRISWCPVDENEAQILARKALAKD